MIRDLIAAIQRETHAQHLDDSLHGQLIINALRKAPEIRSIRHANSISMKNIIRWHLPERKLSRKSL
jgi:hypothetical protein